MAWTLVKKRTLGSRNIGRAPDSVVATHYKSAQRNSGTQFSICVMPHLAKELRWKFGDRFFVVFDSSNGMIGLQRTTDAGGYMMTTSGAKRNKCTNGVHSGWVKVSPPPEIACLLKVGTSKEIERKEIFFDAENDLIAFDSALLRDE